MQARIILLGVMIIGVLALGVLPVNEAFANAPTLHTIPDQTGTVGEEISFTVSATVDASKNLEFIAHYLRDDTSLNSALPFDGVEFDRSTGEFTWTPIESQVGEHTIEFVAYSYETGDYENGASSVLQNVTFTITSKDISTDPTCGTGTELVNGQCVPSATNSDNPIVITNIPDYNGYVNNPISFTVSATDSDVPAQDFVFSITTETATEGATIDSKTGVFTWTPTTTGTYSIAFTVHDGDLASNSAVVEFVITDHQVPDDNKPPVITSTIPFEQYTVGDTISYTVTASNPETDQILSYHFNHAPYDGATIDSKTGVFTWTPTASGNINHNIIVYDGPKNHVNTLTVQTTIVVNVVGTESPLLVLTGDNPQKIIQGDTYQELGASCTYLGNEANLDIDARELDTTTVGKYNVVYYCDDGSIRVFETRIIDVVSHPPILNTIPDITITEDTTKSITVSISNSIENVEYSLTKAPNFVTISGDTITASPPNNLQYSSYLIEVKATNLDDGNVDLEDFIININKSTIPSNTPTSINIGVLMNLQEYGSSFHDKQYLKSIQLGADSWNDDNSEYSIKLHQIDIADGSLPALTKLHYGADDETYLVHLKNTIDLALDQYDSTNGFSLINDKYQDSTYYPFVLSNSDVVAHGLDSSRIGTDVLSTLKGSDRGTDAQAMIDLLTEPNRVDPYIWWQYEFNSNRDTTYGDETVKRSLLTYHEESGYIVGAGYHPVAPTEGFSSQLTDFVGPFTSANLAPLLGFITDNGYSLVSPSSNAEVLAVPDNVIRMIPPVSSHIPSMIDLMISEGRENIIVIHRDDTWGNGIVELLQNNNNDNITFTISDELRLQTSHTENIDFDSIVATLNTEINTINNIEKTGVLYVGFEGNFILLAAAIDKLDNTSPIRNISFYGTDGIAESEDITNNAVASKIADELNLVAVSISIDPTSENISIKEKLSQIDDASSDVFALTSYDAVGILADSIVQDTVLAQYVAQSDFTYSGAISASGNIVFDDNGDLDADLSDGMGHAFYKIEKVDQEYVWKIVSQATSICAITTPTTTIDFGLVKPGYIFSSENAKITIDVNQNNKDLIGLETYSSSWTVNGEIKLDNKFVEVKDENGEWKSLDTIVRVDTPVTKGSSTTLEYRVNLEGESMTLDSQNLSLNIGVLGICQK